MTSRITSNDLKILLNDINAAHGFEGEIDYNTKGAFAINGSRLVQYLAHGEKHMSVGCCDTKKQLYAFMLGMLAGLSKTN